MPSRFHIIDGYNLLYAAGLGKADYRPGELLRARSQLLKRLLEQLSPAELERTTVVFDAREPPPGRPDRVNVGGITVLFAREGGVADDLILDLVRTHSAPRHLTVVSSDHRIQRGVRSRRGEAIDSPDFLDRISGRARAGKSPSSPPNPEADKPQPAPAVATPSEPSASPAPTSSKSASERELEHWLGVFSGVDTRAEVADGELPDPVTSTGSEASRVPPRSRTSPVTPPEPGPASAGNRSGQSGPRARPKSSKPRSGSTPPSPKPLPDATDLAAWESMFGDIPISDEQSVTPLLPSGQPRTGPLPGEETSLGRRRALPPASTRRPERPPVTRSPDASSPSTGASAPTEPLDTRDQPVDVDYWLGVFGESGDAPSRQKSANDRDSRSGDRHKP